MENIYTIINRYYNTFESYSPVLKLNCLRMWLLVVSVLASFLVFGIFSDLVLSDLFFEVSKLYKYMLLMASGGTATVAFAALQSKRDKLVENHLRYALSAPELKIWELKALWLKEHLLCQPDKYLDLAESIDKTISLREKYRSAMDFTKADVFSYLFSKESKPRVLAMFLMFCAAIISLSLSGGANLESVIQFYSDLTWTDVGLALYFITIFYAGFILIKLGLKFLSYLVERVFEKLNGENAYSKHRAKIFINELLRRYNPVVVDKSYALDHEVMYSNWSISYFVPRVTSNENNTKAAIHEVEN